MKQNETLSLFTVRLRHERHVVHARQRAREIAALLGFEHQEQIRLATAVSELARNAFRYAQNGVVDFRVEDGVPQLFMIRVTDGGPGISNLAEILEGRYVSRTGLGNGILGTRRLMDRFDIQSASSGTIIEACKALPVLAPRVDAARVKWIAAELARTGASDPFDEVERQNQELLRTLSELREKQDQLNELNQELEDTNRGVVALYAELEQNSDDLRRVSNLKSSFLSNLSHEFRTPLNSISSLCMLLTSRSDGDLTAEQQKQVSFIRRASDELMELVNDLLDLAKVESGKIDVKLKHFEVQDLFGALRGMLRPLLTGTSVDLMFDAEPNLPPLHTDEGKISQILRNLISNALKFTRRGYVRLTAHAEGYTIVFRVEDTGIGIAPENLDKIFDEFVQIENDLQTRFKGTGLGLPLTKRLAELLGGSVSVQSTLGTGSTFEVRLPVRYGGSEPEPRSTAAITSVNGPNVLFIEDNRETNFVHQSSLRVSDYNLHFALNIPEAREVMRGSKLDLIALDRFIDGEDSLSFIKEVKEAGYTGPILVVSVVNDEETSLLAGANAFLHKPITPFKLISVMRELLAGQTCKTVLVADDDEVSRYLMAEALVLLGFNIVEAQNGRDAISIIQSIELHGVILDVVMPGLNGLEVLREVRRDSRYDKIPIIMHSSMELSPRELEMIAHLHASSFSKQAFSSETGAAQLADMMSAAGLMQ